MMVLWYFVIEINKPIYMMILIVFRHIFLICAVLHIISSQLYVFLKKILTYFLTSVVPLKFLIHSLSLGCAGPEGSVIASFESN